MVRDTRETLRISSIDPFPDYTRSRVSTPTTRKERDRNIRVCVCVCVAGERD